jgi:hypothetical protein
VQELDLKRLPYLQLTEGRSGVGSILFTMPGPGVWSSSMSPWWSGYADHGVAFRAIPDVAAVYRTIQGARSELDA